MLSLPPPTRIPVGYVLVDGKRLDVFLNQEWARYFDSLTDQVVTTSETVVQQATTGTMGAAGVGVSMSDDGGSSVEFIPGPRGEQGPQGAAGTPIFLMQEPEDIDVFWPIRNS